MTSFITSLAIAIEHAVSDVDGLLSVWLFGSALLSAEPADLDLLIVYDREQIPPAEAASLREMVARAVRSVSALDVDAVVLSEEEAAESGFAKRERARRIYNRDKGPSVA